MFFPDCYYLNVAKFKNEVAFDAGYLTGNLLGHDGTSKDTKQNMES